MLGHIEVSGHNIETTWTEKPEICTVWPFTKKLSLTHGLDEHKRA